MASMQESHSVAWGTCYGVGVGSGDPELLTLKAARVIGACQVVAAPQTRGGATLALDIAAQAVDLEGKDIIRLPFAMSRDAGERQRMHEESVGLIAEQLAQGKDVAVLTLGDPGVFSSFVFGNGFLDILAARFRQSGKRTADVSDFCLPEHQGLVHPLARAVELDESSMVDHPVDHRGGKLVVAQDRSPFAELDVGGEHHASLLVAC